MSDYRVESGVRVVPASNIFQPVLQPLTAQASLVRVPHPPPLLQRTPPFKATRPAAHKSPHLARPIIETSPHFPHFPTSIANLASCPTKTP